MKYMAEKGKIAAKKWVLGAKSGLLGVEKIRVGNQTRKAKWCKTQLAFLKNGQSKRYERVEIVVIYLLFHLYFR